MSQTTASTAGLVRPRFDDGTFDEPLLLEDHVLEHVVHGREPAQVIVEGPRGSGLSTTIERLRERVVAEGKLVVGISDVLAPAVRAVLDHGRAVLLLDLSIGGAPAGVREYVVRLSQAWAGWRVVAAVPEGSAWIASDTVKLAPWTWDDVIDLLGGPAYREHRARILAALRALPDGAALVSRPRTARWLCDAALALGPDEPATLARLYANVLDTLHPSTLEALRRLPTGDYHLEGFFRAISGLADFQVEEVSALFELDDQLTALLATREGQLQLALAHVMELFLARPRTRLALPGLQHLLQAGRCLERVAQDEAPDLVAPSWYPYLRELVTEPLKARLRGWLTGDLARPSRDGPAATLLWACGETPPLDAATRSPVLVGADLQGLSVPGANLTSCSIERSKLDGARLEGASLVLARIEDSTLEGAVLDGADLSKATVLRSTLHDASLRGAAAHVAHLDACDLRGADLEGARLDRSTLRACLLGGANLRRASLLAGELAGCALPGAWLEQVDLRRATLELLDLTKAAAFAPATLADATLVACELAGLLLDDLVAPDSVWRDCDLFEVRLAGARLERASFVHAKLHGAVLRGADLRGAVFEHVSFQAGSTRTGLLIGKPALEGNMTGYYVEGTTDDAWASLESIRQADLRGADLRGARFTATNLFRVDLRGARLDPETRRMARDHGAILD